MPELRLPPRDIGGFPRRSLRATVRLSRIHPVGRRPWWFSSNGSGRFDLDAPEGTCYLSLSPLGAFVETFRELDIVSAVELTTRRLSRLHAPRDVVLADCTSPRARMFGVTAAVHSTAAYAVTQAWAAAWRAGGFDGVRYFCGHDPSQQEVGIALFGEAGETDWPATNTGPVTYDLLEAAERRFGIHTAPGRKPSE